MKVLIWIVFMSVPGIINLSLRKVGIWLGGIPTALLYGGCFYAARTLCVKHDIKKFEKEAKANEQTPMEYAKTKFNPVLLESFELNKHDKAEFKKLIKHYSSVGQVSSADANILYYLFLGELR